MGVKQCLFLFLSAGLQLLVRCFSAGVFSCDAQCDFLPRAPVVSCFEAYVSLLFCWASWILLPQKLPASSCPVNESIIIGGMHSIYLYIIYYYLYLASVDELDINFETSVNMVP